MLSYEYNPVTGDVLSDMSDQLRIPCLCLDYISNTLAKETTLGPSS